MKTKINLLILLSCIHIASYAQYTCIIEDLPPDSSQFRSSRIGSSESFYSDLNNWIPRLTPGEPLKNPPIMTIEISFHVFLDNNGGNNIFTDTEWGRNQLIWIFNHVNEIYAGYAEHENNYQKGSSDSVPGLIELPDCDTKIRFSLQGKQLKQILLNGRGAGSETLHAHELHAGMYLYSLIVNGNVADTKRMTLTK